MAELISLDTVEAVTKVANAIIKVKEALDALGSSRSVILRVENETDSTLFRYTEGHSHGGWGETPAAQIPPRTAMICSSRSTGFLTGTEGAIYYAEYNTPFYWLIVWNNPYIGGNDCGSDLLGTVDPYAVLTMPGLRAFMRPRYFFGETEVCGAGEQEAEMRYSLYGFGRQSNWRWCHKCQGLFFGGNPGSRCPAGGEHENRGSSNYVLVNNSPRAPGQRNWRWCHKCQGLFFGGNPNPRCPAGGAHEAVRSGNYSLIDTDWRAPGQNGWRWCHKCQGLFFGGNPGPRCPAGGAHEAVGSGNYTLAQQ